MVARSDTPAGPGIMGKSAGEAENSEARPQVAPAPLTSAMFSTSLPVATPVKPTCLAISPAAMATLVLSSVIMRLLAVPLCSMRSEVGLSQVEMAELGDSSAVSAQLPAVAAPVDSQLTPAVRAATAIMLRNFWNDTARPPESMSVI
ncbi:hypothetical protein GCM10023334_110400 [Nonomuraea thailandensis]